MNISKETLAYLKSFSQINPSIWVGAGNQLRTMSPNKTVVASATVTDEFPVDFGIYDLNTFLSVISLMDDPDFDFGSDYVTLKSGRSKVRYGYVSKKVIVCPPEKDLSLPDEALNVELTNDNFQRVMKAVRVMSTPNVVFSASGGELQISAADMSNADSNRYDVSLGEHGEDCQFTFREENLRVIEGDYEVIISSKGIAQFRNKSQDVTYFIATEKD